MAYYDFMNDDFTIEDARDEIEGLAEWGLQLQECIEELKEDLSNVKNSSSYECLEYKIKHTEEIIAINARYILKFETIIKRIEDGETFTISEVNRIEH